MNGGASVSRKYDRVDLSLESSMYMLCVDAVGPDDLDGYVAAQPEMMCGPDHAHAAFADGTLESILCLPAQGLIA